MKGGLGGRKVEVGEGKAKRGKRIKKLYVRRIEIREGRGWKRIEKG